MQQIVPFRQSTVDIHFKSNEIDMTTQNVARLCLKEPVVSPVIWNQRGVQIDGTEVTILKYQGQLKNLLPIQELFPRVKLKSHFVN